jgi:hypothetical protein
MKLRRAKSSSPGEEIALPERSEAVTLVRSSGERVQARVAERNETELSIALMFRPERPLGAGDTNGLLLEFTNSAGRVRLQGEVTLVDRELVRFRDVSSVEQIQQREYVRVRSTRPVAVISGGVQSSLQTFSVDLSGGGMLLAGPSTLRVGEQIQFRLTTVQGNPPVSGVATVVRADSQGRRAVCFDEISEGDHRRLVRFIFECQRAERRRGLEEGRHHG